jgi:hypothetical protein
LSGLSQGIKGEIVIVFDLVMHPHEVQSRPQSVRQRVLVGDPEDDHTSSVVAIEVDPLSDLPTCNGQEHCPSGREEEKSEVR